jgi:hypothetical protein
MESPTVGDADAPLARKGDTMNEQHSLTSDERGGAGPGRVSRQRWRTIVAVLLIVVGCVLAPLAADPAIQTAIADQITTQIFTYLDIGGLTNQAVDALAKQRLRPQVADQLRGLRTILVLALVVAAGAFLTGQSATAVRIRRRLAAGIGRLRGGAEHAGWRTGPVATWVDANKQLLRIAAVALAGLALVFWGQPTGRTILGLAGLLLVALAVIEFLSQPPQLMIVAPTTQS